MDAVCGALSKAPSLRVDQRSFAGFNLSPDAALDSTLPDAPHVRNHNTAVVMGDKLYAIGGRDTSLHDSDNFISFR